MRGRRVAKHNLILVLAIIVASLLVYVYASYAPYPFNPFASMVFGYEGSKIYLDKICVKGECYSVDSSKPYGASTWIMAADHWDIDPDAECDGFQNFAGTVDTNGKFEQTPLGTPIVDSVEWTKTYVEGDKIVSKKFRGQIWYFDHVINLMTRVDECVLYGVGYTEKGDPVRDATIGFWVHVENWAPEGNNTPQNFAAILGVEVIDVKVYHVEDGRRVEGMAPGMTVHLNFHKGQMLALKGRESISGAEYKQYLESTQPDISPDQNLSKDAYFELHISELGALGAGWFDEWHEPVVEVKLRVHVLKVDSWIAIQKRHTPPEPPDWSEINPFQEIAEWVNKTFGISAAIVGWAIIGIIIFLLFMFAMIIVVFVAARLGVRVKGGG